jgi:cation:H+ antiporter
MIAIVFIVLGAAFLVKGADLLVEGGAGIALKSGISPLIVGLTVVAFGTSAPELAASLIAALNGSGDISFGNVVGSNVANIALILGVTALIRPLPVNKLLARWELPFMIGITVLAWGLGTMGYLSRWHGLVLLALFGYYLHHCMKSPPVPIEVDDATAGKRSMVLWIMVVVGIAGLGIGGVLFVDGARTIALALGVSEAVIGMTVVALGTSLPELLTSAVAAARGHADISLGNIVGSNIFNILLVLGATASITPYSISPDRFLTLVGMPFMFGLAVILVLLALSGRRINRLEGAFFSIAYIAYITLAVIIP